VCPDAAGRGVYAIDKRGGRQDWGFSSLGGERIKNKAAKRNRPYLIKLYGCAFYRKGMAEKMSDLEPHMSDLRSFIGSKIKERRKELGMSQSDLADLMACEPPLISRYERGVTMPTIEQLIKIAESLVMPLDQLIPSPKDDPERLKIAYLREVINTKLLYLKEPEKLEKIICYIDKISQP
jgi:transcriptional regulator with XRE-family HTH domain